MGFEWDFTYVLKFQEMLWWGLLGTLKVGLVSLCFGAMIGLGLALMRLSRYRAFSVPATAVIEFFRTTPLLIQLFWVYFALPIVIGVKFDAYTAGVITLSVQSGSFFAEVFRAGILSIDKSQWDGGRALGMTARQLMRRIVLPQAVRRMISPFLERAFELMKGTTQVATISYGELLYNAMTLTAQLYRPLEIYTARQDRPGRTLAVGSGWATRQRIPSTLHP